MDILYEAVGGSQLHSIRTGPRGSIVTDVDQQAPGSFQIGLASILDSIFDQPDQAEFTQGGEPHCGDYTTRTRAASKLNDVCGMVYHMAGILLMADIHSNLRVFEVVLQAARDAGGFQAVRAFGGLEGYGAEPEERVAQLGDMRAERVSGNHDSGSIGCRLIIARPGRQGTEIHVLRS